MLSTRGVGWKESKGALRPIPHGSLWCTSPPLISSARTVTLRLKQGSLQTARHFPTWAAWMGGERGGDETGPLKVVRQWFQTDLHWYLISQLQKSPPTPTEGILHSCLGSQSLAQDLHVKRSWLHWSAKVSNFMDKSVQMPTGLLQFPKQWLLSTDQKGNI